MACDESGVFIDSSTILAPVAPQVRKLDDAVTIFSVPFKRMGLVPFGGRSVSPTVVSQPPFAPLIDPLSLWTDGDQAAIRQRLARSFTPALPRNPSNHRGDGTRQTHCHVRCRARNVHRIVPQGCAQPFVLTIDRNEDLTRACLDSSVPRCKAVLSPERDQEVEVGGSALRQCDKRLHVRRRQRRSFRGGHERRDQECRFYQSSSQRGDYDPLIRSRGRYH